MNKVLLVEAAVASLNPERAKELKALAVKVGDVITTAERCAGAYFWTDNGNQSVRYGRAKHMNIEPFEFTFAGVEWSLGYSFSQSRKNTYTKGLYYRDGNRTTLTAVRTLQKNLLGCVDGSIIKGQH